MLKIFGKVNADPSGFDLLATNSSNPRFKTHSMSKPFQANIPSPYLTALKIDVAVVPKDVIEKCRHDIAGPVFFLLRSRFRRRRLLLHIHQELLELFVTDAFPAKRRAKKETRHVTSTRWCVTQDLRVGKVIFEEVIEELEQKKREKSCCEPHKWMLVSWQKVAPHKGAP